MLLFYNNLLSASEEGGANTLRTLSPLEKYKTNIDDVDERGTKTVESF